MTNRRQIRRLPLLLMMGLLVGAVLFGCDTINEPEYDNPLDPDGTVAGDGAELAATYTAGWVKLTWSVPAGPAIDQIVIEYIQFGQPMALDTVATTPKNYIHTSPRGNEVNEYRLKAMDASGRVSQTSHVVPAALHVPPVIYLPDASHSSEGVKIFQAVQDIQVLAATGDVAQVDTVADFSTTDIVPLVDGIAVYEDVRLLKQRFGDVVSNTRSLYVRAGVIGDTDTSWTEDDMMIQQELVTGISKVGGGSDVAEPFVDISLANGGVGVDSLRFAPSWADMDTAAWRPIQDVYERVELIDTIGEQHVRVQYASSFGDLITGVKSDSLRLVADDLTSASVTPVLPTNGIVSGVLVHLEMSAVATEMRISQNIGFLDTDWQPYAETVMFTLADEPDTQTVFTQFRNHWNQTMDSIVTELPVSASVLDLAFSDPTEGLAVSGGDTITVTGTVGPVPDGYELTTVEVNLGDGFTAVSAPEDGWASPTATWTTSWPVPVFDADTPVRIGITASATEIGGEETRDGTSWIEVTVSQLTLTLDDPENGEEIITGGGAVSISGTAGRDLTTVPLDSIVVTAGDTTMVAASGLDAWSVDWNAPVVEEDTPATITATVHAGDENLSSSIDVVLLPPEPEEEEEEE